MNGLYELKNLEIGDILTQVDISGFFVVKGFVYCSELKAPNYECCKVCKGKVELHRKFKLVGGTDELATCLGLTTEPYVTFSAVIKNKDNNFLDELDNLI